jgi:dimethylargininase
MLLALTRAVPPSIDRCELTHLDRTPIDYAQAVREHATYEDALRQAGCVVQRLPELPDNPDSVFVEDTAVVIDELAVMARPGAVSRRGEVDSMADALRPFRQLAYIQAPGTLDGGDVLVTPGKVFVGITARTNADGARQLADHLAPFGYETIRVPVTGCLHLKSAVTLCAVELAAGGGSYMTINPSFVDRSIFRDFELIEVDPSEPMAGNVLLVQNRVICAEEHPLTRQRIQAFGLVTQSVPARELAKAEGGVTCCSVIVPNA